MYKLKREEQLTTFILVQVDYTLTLDIPDQLPSHLAGEEVHLTQNSQNIDAFSQASSSKSLRGKASAAINLPEPSLPSNESYSDAMDDMSELLAPGFDSMGGENPLDIPFEELDGSVTSGGEPGQASKKSSSKAPSGSLGSPGNPSSSGQGADVSEYDALMMEPADAYEPNNLVCV